MKVEFKLLTPTAKIPSFAHENDAGSDIYSSEFATVPSGGSRLISTGIAWQPIKEHFQPMKMAMMIKSKSGLSVKHKIEVGAGVIDESYRGEIKVHLFNNGDSDFEIEVGDKIAQAVYYYLPFVDISEAEGDLSETVRGDGGFGSTGKK